MRFSNLNRAHLMKDLADSELNKVKRSIPWVTLLLTGTTIGVYYCGQTWPHRKSRTHLTFCETNFYNLKQYQTFFLSPLFYENDLFFYCNLPGLFYSSLLIERFFGSRVLLLSFFTNCAVSAPTTV